MKDADHRNLSWDEWDEMRSPRPEVTDFDVVVEKALSRRGFLSGVLAFGSGAAVMGTGLLSGTSAEAQSAAMRRFGFTPIDIQTDLSVHVPEGYSWNVLTSWGEPLFSDTPEFDHATGGTAESQARAVGENTDGMELFNVGGRQVIAVNHEYANPETNLPLTTGEVLSAEDALKLKNAQGVAVFEVARGDNGYAVVKDSPFNRRITHDTPMRLEGPAAGHDLLKTSADPEGRTVLGTLNNCGAGKTPWGTYLTCEENFNGYFGSLEEGADVPAEFGRYGILSGPSRYAYEKFDARFDVTKEPNEPNRFGYIVEIDPADPESTPIKRTALGRFKHENAACTLAPDGRVVVYMGDDERGEFLYKFVSNGVYQAGGDTSGLLNEGTLYVAKFYEEGRGEWLALTEDATGMSAAEIAIFTRQAASKLGATTMDRPEWVAVNPHACQAYCALTNNKNRGIKPNAGGDATPAEGPNPREANEYGQIVRWFPENEDHAAIDFVWDLYVMAGNPDVHSDAYAGSPNVTSGNMFNSPDGMMFDSRGLLWIQTDGDDSNEGDFAGQGNNQMLVGDPVTGEIARFLTGPNGSEVTGLTWSSDKRTMFVGIQHPGGSFPSQTGLPRSSIVAVWRNDGAMIG